MSFTKEQVEKTMSCKTADELLALAKSEGVELTREEAEAFLAKLKTKEITAEELEQVAGGGWLPSKKELLDLMGAKSIRDNQDELCKSDLTASISAPRR